MDNLHLPEDNIPEPSPRRPRNLVPINLLEVGQSIAFSITSRPYVAVKATNLKKKTGKEFTIRKLDDETCRIWRTK